MFSVYFEYFLFVILVISRFGFEGWIWVLIASVPGICILVFTLKFLGASVSLKYNLSSYLINSDKIVR